MNRRNVTTLIALGFQLVCSPIISQRGLAQKQVPHVRFTELIKSPTKYDGKTIAMKGFLVIGSERTKVGLMDGVLFKTQLDAIQFFISKSFLGPDVGILPNKEMLRDQGKLDYTYVTVIGVFRARPAYGKTFWLRVQSCTPSESPRR